MFSFYESLTKLTIVLLLKMRQIVTKLIKTQQKPGLNFFS
jgi:hypothetical protein